MSDQPQDSMWPVPKFYFKVSIEGLGEIAFQEVSGLDADFDMVEYRIGNAVDFSTAKMPGLIKGSDVTLKKGMFKDNAALLEYFNEVKMNTIKRSTVTIQLLDEAHNPMFIWVLKNAHPLKITGSNDLNAQNSEAAIEELVLAHEGLSFEKA